LTLTPANASAKRGQPHNYIVICKRIETMQLRKHLKLLVVVSLGWLLFWIAWLPDYGQQYSVITMIIFDLAVLPPIWFLIYRSVKDSKPGRGLKVSLWWSFYISFPLFMYDLIYCGVYLGRGISFLWEYWYLTVYYIIPWLLFPPMGWLIEKKRNQHFNLRETSATIDKSI